MKHNDGLTAPITEPTFAGTDLMNDQISFQQTIMSYDHIDMKSSLSFPQVTSGKEDKPKGPKVKIQIILRIIVSLL